ncbi:MAG: hypothetical protein ACI867_001222 [Glaciecola sp.]|jgi:hypothetical protein
MTRTPAALRRRAVAVVAACAVALAGVVAPSLAQDADQDTLRHELDVADEELGAAQDRLERARAQLDALDSEAAKSASELSIISAQLDAAAAAATAAGRAARDATNVVAGLDQNLTAQRQLAQVREAAHADRVIWIWKHGAGADAALRLQLATRARSNHDLIVGQRMVDALVKSSRGEVFTTRARLVQMIAARDVSGRDKSRRDDFEARGEAAEVDVLRRQQLAVTVRLVTLRTEHGRIVQELAADRDAVAALANTLRRMLSRISLSGALVPPADLPLDGPTPPWVSALPDAGAAWAIAVQATAVRRGLDGALFTALVWSESGFHANAVSHAGAIGLSQLMPGTAAGLGVDPWNPYENLDGGARYLRAQIERFGQADLGLAAYNAGPGRVQRAGNTIPNIVETQIYVLRVLERWELLRNAA